ncbi:MAG: sugar phosphate isomerase/epimerase family protein [Phycisphaerales bacterium]
MNDAPSACPSPSVCSWSLRPREASDLAAMVRQTGGDSIQLALMPLLDGGPWANAASVLAKESISITSGMVAMAGEDYSTLESIARTGGVRPDATWPENLRRCREAAALAEDLGLRLVTFHAGFIPEDAADPGRDAVLGRLRELADLFADRGIRIGLETGQETADTLLEALEALDRPEVGVNFDPANMILYGMGDPVASLSKLAPRVVAMHAKDAVPTEVPGTWGREVPLGEGAVDWPALLAVAATIPNLPIAIEREAGEHRVEEIRIARERLTAWWPMGH